MKKYRNYILQIFVFTILLTSTSVIFAWMSPLSLPGSATAGPIKTSGINIIGEPIVNTSGYSLAILKTNVIGELGGEGSMSTQYLNVDGNKILVNGDVKASNLAHGESGVLKKVCFDSSAEHKLVKCSGPAPVLTNGECKSYPDAYESQPATSSSTGCSSGFYQDSTDTSTTWNWKCNGKNGGTDANCMADSPYPTTDACYTGFYEVDDPHHPEGGSVAYTNALGQNVSETRIWSGDEVWISYKTGTNVAVLGCSPC